LLSILTTSLVANHKASVQRPTFIHSNLDAGEWSYDFPHRTANRGENASKQFVEESRSMNRRTISIWAIAGAIVVVIVAILWLRMGHWRPRAITIQGAVIRRDSDTRKEVPIADAVVTASNGVTSATVHTDSSGYFKLTFPGRVWLDEVVNLQFRHPDYQPLDFKIQVGFRPDLSRLYVAKLEPIEAIATREGLPSVVSNIRVRYTVNFQSETNIGTAVKTFQVVNRANMPCDQKYPCSPDGVWKASTGSTTLDAGPDNEFRSVRVSCIAGPCPFTRIDSSGFIHGGRTISVSAIDWSDTATFLLEAEVFRDSTGSSVRESYPVIYGQVLHFTVPANQEGVTIEAEINGAPMVFPLGAGLDMSWANCSSRASSEGEGSTVYQCELKPDYQF
jgi:hypothetical protein